VAISIVNAISDSVLYDVIQVPFYMSELTSLLLIQALLIFVFRLPFWYSLLLNFSFTLLDSLSQIIVAIPLTKLTNIHLSDLNTDPFAVCLLQFICFIVQITVSVYLYRKGIGFLFVSEKINIKREINAWVFALVTISIVLFEYVTYYVVNQHIQNSSIFHPVLCMIIIAFALIAIKVRLDWKRYYK
jgi:hypothetical protein